MASSGTINATQSGTQPYLRISWSILSQDVPNNRSRVRLQLILVSTHTLSFSASKTGTNNGASFTYTGGFSGTGTRVLNTREIWVNHNSDGTRTQSVSGSFNIDVTWSGSSLNSLSVSGNMNLDAIPRASTLNSFSIGSALRPGTANTVRLSISRASGSFTHDIQLRDGSTVIASWNGEGVPTSLNLSAAQVDTLLSRMHSVTSRELTLKVQTKSGSTNIGGAVTRNANATVDSSVTPNASGLSVSINGNGRDRTIGHYVQNISRVSASFNTSATGGATISSRRIVIRRSSDNANTMTINSGSGTTDILTHSGQYSVTATVTDSRGRTAQATTTFSVTAYSSPSISSFTAKRSESNPETVNIYRAGTHSPISGTLNPLTIVVEKREPRGTWSSVATATSTGTSFGADVISTGNSVTSSYEFRVTVTDSFGNNAEATATVPTQRVVLDIHKNEGVGIGKLHEEGALDISGLVHIHGDALRLFNNANTLQIRSTDANGHGFMSWFGSDGVRKGYLGFPSPSNDFMEWSNESGGQIRLRGSELIFNGTQVVASGSNSNGNWVRFYDGTQICWNNSFNVSTQLSNASGSLFRSGNVTWNFPIAFTADVSVSATSGSWVTWVSSNGNGMTFAHFVQWSTSNRLSVALNTLAIGRWR